MKLYSPIGTQIVGTLELCPGRAIAFEYELDGTPRYDGETMMFWDDQKTVIRGTSRVYLDEDGNEWTFDQLKPEPEEGDK